MNAFFWSAGHLGWGLFALVVFTGLWLLLADIVWRLVRMRALRLTAAVAAGWIIGVVVIVFAFGG